MKIDNKGQYNHPGADTPTSWFNRANKKLIVTILIVLVSIASLMVINLRGTLTYYVTVDELKAENLMGTDHRYRVGGRVLTGTIDKDASNNLSFVIYHNDIDTNITVHYRGIIPDIFGDEVDVIVEGLWGAEGIFRATNLIAQHPPEFKIAEPGKPHGPVQNRSIE